MAMFLISIEDWNVMWVVRLLQGRSKVLAQDGDDKRWTASSTQEDDAFEVEQVQVVHRHGDRAPLGWVPHTHTHAWKCDSTMAHAAPVTMGKHTMVHHSTQQVEGSRQER